jgi:hypothetical protein
VPAQHVTQIEFVSHLFDHRGLPGPCRTGHQERAAQVKRGVDRVDKAGWRLVLAML